jgi:hypothetical protein
MAFSQFNQSIEGRRKTGGEYVNGRWNPSADTPFSITASIQPANGIELQLLPEGRREAGAYSLRSSEEILTGDIFRLFGQDFEVLHAEIWQNSVIPHYLALCSEMLEREAS